MKKLSPGFRCFLHLLAVCVVAGLMLSLAGCSKARAAEEASPFLKDAALAAEVARNCGAGCLVLSPAEAQSMMDTINAKLQEREFAAFAAGVVAGKEMERAVCRNRI